MLWGSPKDELCLEDIQGLPINLDENIALQNVSKLSKLLAKIVQWSNAKRMHKKICKSFCIEIAVNGNWGITLKVRT